MGGGGGGGPLGFILGRTTRVAPVRKWDTSIGTLPAAAPLGNDLKVIRMIKSLGRAGSSCDGDGTGIGPCGCLVCRQVQVPGVSDAKPNDVNPWQALEHQPSLNLCKGYGRRQVLFVSVFTILYKKRITLYMHTVL